MTSCECTIVLLLPRPAFSCKVAGHTHLSALLCASPCCCILTVSRQSCGCVALGCVPMLETSGSWQALAVHAYSAALRGITWPPLLQL